MALAVGSQGPGNVYARVSRDRHGPPFGKSWIRHCKQSSTWLKSLGMPCYEIFKYMDIGLLVMCATWLLLHDYYTEQSLDLQIMIILIFKTVNSKYMCKSGILLRIWFTDTVSSLRPGNVSPLQRLGTLLLLLLLLESLLLSDFQSRLPKCFRFSSHLDYKLRLLIGDNIPDFPTVSEYRK